MHTEEEQSLTKIIKYELFFVLLFVFIIGLPAIYDVSLRNTERERIQYDNAIDHAVEDGVYHMVEYDSMDEIVINKDAAVENYFRAAYAGLGIGDSPTAQSWLQIYTPVILITDIDGFYIYHCREIPMDDGVDVSPGWSEKYTYSYQSEHYVISFSINDIVKILNKDTGVVQENDYRELVQRMPELVNELPFFRDAQSFCDMRNVVISDAITNAMEYYINEHNRIAEDYGIKYHFFLPTITTDDWERAINGLAMMVIFQGYPYKSTRGYFNMVEVGGARIAKDTNFYITQQQGRKTYHSADCSLLRQDALNEPYDKARDCALEGAYPCNLCRP